MVNQRLISYKKSYIIFHFITMFSLANLSFAQKALKTNQIIIFTGENNET